MFSFNLYILFKSFLRHCLTIAVCGLFLLSCENNEDEKIVLIAANPASIQIGETVSVELRSLAPVFVPGKIKRAVSDGGLFLRELSVLDSQNAIATFGTAQVQSPGVHQFELDFGDTIGVLEMSAIAVPVGPGTATISRNTATAGARMAEFRISGDGTHFDSDVMVDVEGAPDMQILGTDLLSGSTLDVYFSIEVTQRPVSATIVLMDGAFRYEFPFEITAPAAYENIFENQVLTRGQVGTVKFGGMGPTLYEGSRPATLPAGIDIGDTTDASHGVSMAMRVPENFAGNALTFDMQTWLNGGATLETLTTTVKVVDPAFIVASPSVLLSGSGQTTLSMKTRGVAFSNVDDLILDGSDLFVMTNWSATDASATVITSVGTLTDNYAMQAIVGDRIIDTQVTVVENHDSAVTYAGLSDVREGDRLYVPVSVASNDLNSSELTVTGTDDITVLETTVVDSGTVVLDIKVADDVQTGSFGSLQRLGFESNGKEHSVYLNIIESGVAAP